MGDRTASALFHSRPQRLCSPHTHLIRGKIMKASALSFQAAVILVIAGMLWGIIMAISNNHAAMPAHAHLNLLGWVSLFLFGIYYRLNPSLEAAATALVQVWVWIAATVVIAIGVGLVTTGSSIGEPIAAVGSFVALFDMLLFAWLVFRAERSNATLGPIASPAR
jgi:hypothetical protein